MRWSDKLAYELQKPVIRHFLRGINEAWAVDLIDMLQYSDDNYKYILVVIDVFSKFQLMRVLKLKTDIEVLQGN